MTNPFDDVINPKQKMTPVGDLGEWSYPYSNYKGIRSNNTESQTLLKYGFLDATVVPELRIAAGWNTQATNYVKKVKIVGYVGTSPISEYETWMRVHREIYVPSTNSLYRAHKLKIDRITLPNPMLPCVGYANPNVSLLAEARGSIPDSGPDETRLRLAGQYVLLWLRWQGISHGSAGKQEVKTFAVLFDWYHSGSAIPNNTTVSGLKWGSTVSLNQPPTNAACKSGLLGQFAPNGINSTHSSSNTGINISGAYLMDLVVNGANTRFYLHDHPGEPIPVIQGSDKVLHSRTINFEPATFDSESIRLWAIGDAATILPRGAEPEQVVPTSSGVPESLGLIYSNLIIKFTNGESHLLAVDEDTNEKIKIHTKASQFAASTPFNFNTTGGKAIVATGSTQNYIDPNIQFDYQPNVPYVWEVLPFLNNGDKACPTVVIDGETFGRIYPSLDNKWILGFAPSDYTLSKNISFVQLSNNIATLHTPAAHNFIIGQPVTVAGVPDVGSVVFNGPNTITAVGVSGTTFSYAKTSSTNVALVASVGTASVPDVHAARSQYWYVLPLQVREKVDNHCICKQTESSGTQAKDNFTSPTSVCTEGLHFGKFLKNTASSTRGFAIGQIQTDYCAAITQKAKASVSSMLNRTSMVGYFLSVSGAGRVTTRATQIVFTLNKISGLDNSLGATYPQADYVTNKGNWSKGAGFVPTDPTGAVDPRASSAGGVNSNLGGAPKDWKKAITDALEKLVNPSAIEKLTPERLAKFLKNQLTEGAPLSLLKELVLKSILAAKLAVLQSIPMNKADALVKLAEDPLYKSLMDVISATKRTTGGNTGADTSKTEGDSNPGTTQEIRIKIIRGLPGYTQNTRPTASVAGQPELVQTYTVSTDGTWGAAPVRRFRFPFVPREVSYSGIGTQWTEIPRSGNYPIVDWTGFNLLKISFNFDIVNMDYEGKQGFGLNYSCEKDITTLREMAQTPYPVTFLNMDKFMTDEVRWPLLTSGRGVEFVISEFSVTAVQRTHGSNEISRAQCSMTLQEIPIETLEIVQMPPIKPCPKKLCPGDIPDPKTLKEYLTFSSHQAVGR